MTETPKPPLSPTWAAVVEKINTYQQARRAAPAVATPIAVVTAAFRADPVGVFLRDKWVDWARWQDSLSDWRRIEALVRVANGKPISQRDALALSSSSAIDHRHQPAAQPDSHIDRGLWRDRLHRIAAAQNDKERTHVARSLAPELVKEVADNVVFVVDRSSDIGLKFKMLEVSGSTASLSYAALTLLGADGPGATLCECQLPGCGVFFFANKKREEKRGRKKRRYCSEHLAEGQRLRGRERARKFRGKPKNKMKR